jgi:phosphoglycolate phosphatase
VVGVQPHDSAYVGDSLHDMHAAREAKMKEIGAGYGFAGSQYLQDHGPDHLLLCISELKDLSRDIFSAKAFA